MKQFIYNFFGERAGRIIVASYSWFMGKPLEDGGAIAAQVATESVNDIALSVDHFARVVAQQVAAYKEVQRMYDGMSGQLQEYENQAKLAAERGEIDSAEIAMGQVIELESSLKSLGVQVQQADQSVQAAQAQLRQRQKELQEYKLKEQNLKSLSKITEALDTINSVNNQYNINSARDQFQQAQDSVQRRNDRVNALGQLRENPAEKAIQNLEQLSKSEEVKRRLGLLHGGEHTPLALPDRQSESKIEEYQS
jgi:phage shock protein A